jgi:hypothetical protein
MTVREGDNRPFSEIYREAAMDWVDKDAAARMLEECKTAFLAKMKSETGAKTDAEAERLVKVTPEWKDYIKKMVNAKTSANRAKVQLNYVEMKGWENRSQEATKRAEMRLT